MISNKCIRVSDFTDRQLICVDCGTSFLFRAGEQAFYTSKGLQPPKRCKLCRDYRKTTIVIDDQAGDRDGS
jgi:hypothetical protein